MRLCHVLASAAPRDAITRFALSLEDAARRRGLASAVFAVHVDAELTARIHPLADHPRSAERGDVLVYHASAASPAAKYVAERPEPLALYFHNVTPAHFFDPWWPRYADHLRAARDQIASLAPRVQRALAASTFSASDLSRLGYGSVSVAPLVVDPALYPEVDPASGGPPAVLVLGRVAPHKGIHDVVRAAVVLGRTLPDLRVEVVGALHTEAYVWALHRYRIRVGAANLAFRGSLGQRDLLSTLARSRLLLCLSEHEGFGVPLLEAMGRDVPVVARDTSAVGETCGGAALLLPDANPQLVAGACREVATDEALRSSMKERGRWRWAQASAPAIEEGLIGALTNGLT